MLIGVKSVRVISATERPVEPIYNGVRAETILHLTRDTYPRFVQIPKVGEFTLDVIRYVPLKSEFTRFVGVDVPFIGEFLLDPNEDIPQVGEFSRDRGVDAPKIRELPADGILLRSASIPSGEKIVGHYGALPTVIVTLQNELADKVGSLVTVIMGAIFVICVLAFRRGIVGESLALYRRMIGQKVG